MLSRIFYVAAVFSAMLSIVLTMDMSEIEKSGEKCRSGTTITKEMIVEVLKSENEMEPDYSVKCYFKCLMETIGFMNKGGKIELDAGHLSFQPCADAVASVPDHCQKAYAFHRCLHKEFPDLMVF